MAIRVRQSQSLDLEDVVLQLGDKYSGASTPVRRVVGSFSPLLRQSLLKPLDGPSLRLQVFGAYPRSHLFEPLTYLTKADVDFTWETPQVEAFQKLKRHLQKPPILAHFDEEADTEIHTHASSTGLGAVLVQRTAGLERVISYASRSL